MNKKTKKQKQFIFWCYTSDHDEDWFIQARNRKEAKEMHENYEGYNYEEIKSKIVCEVPRKYHKASPSYPTHKLLKNLGFYFFHEDTPRIVRFNGQIYREGIIINSLYDQEDFRKPAFYILKIRGHNKYKIGFSKNFHQRRKQIIQSVPFPIEIIDVIISDDAEDFEFLVKRRLLRKFIFSGDEWFELDEFAFTLLYLALNLYRSDKNYRVLKEFPTDFFDMIFKQIRNLMNAHKLGELPSVKSRNRIQLLYEVISNREEKPNEIDPNFYFFSKHRLIKNIKSLEAAYIEKFSDIKIGQVVSDKFNVKYKIEKISIYDHVSSNGYRGEIFLDYEGYRVLKNGKTGKTYNHYIQFKSPVKKSIPFYSTEFHL